MIAAISYNIPVKVEHIKDDVILHHRKYLVVQGAK